MTLLQVVVQYAEKKLEQLAWQTEAVKQQIEANESLGKQIEVTLQKKLNSKDVDKCQTYLSELRMVTRLLVNLKTRIAQHRTVAAQSAEDKVSVESVFVSLTFVITNAFKLL